MLTGLSVPHHPQLADGLCLPACAQMVLAYCGIYRSQNSLARQLQTIPGAGTPGSRLRNLASHGLAIHYSEGTLDDLRVAIAHAIPPYCPCEYKAPPALVIGNGPCCRSRCYG
jgi:hypothetical protein